MDRYLALNTTMFAASSLQYLLSLRAQSLRGLFELAAATFKEWRLRSHSRRELTQLDEHQLKDIGLSISQASFESGKSFLEA